MVMLVMTLLARWNDSAMIATLYHMGIATYTYRDTPRWAHMTPLTGSAFL